MASEFSERLSNAEWEAASKANDTFELAVENLKGKEVTRDRLQAKAEEMAQSADEFERKRKRLRRNNKRMARTIAERDAARGITLEEMKKQEVAEANSIVKRAEAEANQAMELAHSTRILADDLNYRYEQRWRERPRILTAVVETARQKQELRQRKKAVAFAAAKHAN